MSNSEIVFRQVAILQKKRSNWLQSTLNCKEQKFVSRFLICMPEDIYTEVKFQRGNRHSILEVMLVTIIESKIIVLHMKHVLNMFLTGTS